MAMAAAAPSDRPLSNLDSNRCCESIVWIKLKPGLGPAAMAEAVVAGVTVAVATPCGRALYKLAFEGVVHLDLDITRKVS